MTATPGTSARDPLTERMDQLARGEAARTAAWPGLDGAIHHDRRVRAVRRGVGGVVAASLAVAVALPFSPIRIEPLDELAASIGLVDHRGGQDKDDDSAPRGLRQDVSPSATPYLEDDAPALPAPSGTRITDSAWLRQAAERAMVVNGYPKRFAKESRTLWAVDDGTWVRAVVTYGSKSEDIDYSVIVLVGRSGTAPGELELAAISGNDPFVSFMRSPLAPVGPGTVAVQSDDAAGVSVSPVPEVDASGTVHYSWHELAEVIPGLYVGDLPSAARGWVASVVSSGRRIWAPPPCSCELPADSAGPEGFLAHSWLGRYAGLGYAGDARKMHFDYLAEDTQGVQLRVRVVGVKTPGGGWLVGGDLTATAKNQGAYFQAKGDWYRLPVVASAAPQDGGTPLVGLAPNLDGNSNGTVLVWAPRDVTTVRSGLVEAPVVDGIALLDLGTGAERVDRLTPQQAVLVQGLDASGNVVARTRVAEPDYSQTVVDPSMPGYEKPTAEDSLRRLVAATNVWGAK